MKVLLVGSGAREHALAWRVSQSPRLTKLYVAPGNAGTSALAENVDIGIENIDGLTTFAEHNEIDFVIAGPEAPLVLGLVDKLEAINIPVFGPDKAASQLEGSKGFMKDILAAGDVPTAFYGRFTDFDAAKAFIEEKGAPIVVKTDGLAAGKGVIICMNEAEAIEAARDMLSGQSFGHAGTEIVIEEFLEGEEISYFAICDGKTVLPLTSAQDHKRAFDGDKGPNTGGMGAYSPAHMMNDALEQQILTTCLEPTLKAMENAGCPFTGVLFAGLMLTKEGPKVLEYNIRFGDPECQALMMRLEGDLLDVLYKASQGRLDTAKLDWSADTAVCVVMAAKGYPGSYQKGTEIRGIEAIEQSNTLQVFHAGTKQEGATVLANGGRVLGVTAKSQTIEKAIQNVYKAVDQIDWSDGFCRRDIGHHALNKDQNAA